MSEESIRANMVRMGFEPDEIDETVRAFRDDQSDEEQPMLAESGAVAA